MNEIAVFWFRRDLRLTDNTGLYHALKNELRVLPIFIFDTDILEKLESKIDARVEFIHATVDSIKKTLQALGSDLHVYHNTPLDAFKQILKQYDIKAVYTNTDYEPAAIKRDAAIESFLAEHGITFKTFKDQVIFEKDEILNETGKPYRVYTPYKNKWLSKLASAPILPFPSETLQSNFIRTAPTAMPALSTLGFQKTNISIPPLQVIRKTITEYDKTRDFPYLENGTSLLGIHFRFGTISVREKVVKALPLNAVWLSELVWREFFMQILYHFPSVLTESFQSKFNVLQWRTSEDDFQKWCDGQTGYPLVDAGMRELNQTGHMHNRVRMVVASFLTKHLFIDWRWGEAYFAQKLLDYDASANNGNWQWAAGTGADAQPYFRIFNPTAQQQKFDPEFIYIKKWVPEFGTSSYIQPIIEHKAAVERAKKMFLVLKN
ncbi:cryptochrome/photolyase family protein [Cytophaga aurantiaca]|uniref:cryptochrome/photolyase family protein n=1 Tax=Cytophaga aurantiaca TaxID=29530 RepID=UPI00037EBF02|nr:deoxyribodipyrimidine photo-lyase [Cytophaga aurantiaca]